MKKIFIGIAFLLSVFTFNVMAKQKVDVYIFYKEGCPYCELAFDYLDELKTTDGDKFDIVAFEVYNSSWEIIDQSKYDLMMEVGNYFNNDVSGVPFIVIGDKYNTNGFDEEVIANEIKETIDKEYNNDNYVDIVDKFKNGESSEITTNEEDDLTINQDDSMILGSSPEEENLTTSENYSDTETVSSDSFESIRVYVIVAGLFVVAAVVVLFLTSSSQKQETEERK